MNLNDFVIENGLIKRIGKFNFNDNIIIATDFCEYNLSDIEPVSYENKYRFYTNDAEFIVDYSEVPGAPFITRAISMRFFD